MASKTKPIPPGYHTMTPYLVVKDAAQAIEFYKRAFAATELYRMNVPQGGVAHAEIQVGDSRLMISDDMPGMPDAVIHSPKALGGSAVGFNLYVEDVDTWFKRAVDAGAKIKRPIKDQFYGDRSGTLEDPFGHVWTVATHVEDVSTEEMKRRMASMS